MPRGGNVGGRCPPPLPAAAPRARFRAQPSHTQAPTMAKTPSKKSAKTAKAAGPKKHKKRTEVSVFVFLPHCLDSGGGSNRALFCTPAACPAWDPPHRRVHTRRGVPPAVCAPREVAA